MTEQTPETEEVVNTPAPAPAPEESGEAVAAPEQPVPAPVSEPEPEPVSSTVMAVGPTLRAARQAMGKELADCAKQLRIRLPFLEALEAGRHADLPGGAYAAGFLRSYAEYLGLDGEEMLRRFRLEGSGGFRARAELSFPSPVTEGRIPGGAVIFLGLILAAVAYGGWYALSGVGGRMAEMVPALPDRLSTVLNRQATVTGESGKATEDHAKVREEVVPPQEAEEDKGSVASAPPPPLPVPPVETAAVAPAPAPAPVAASAPPPAPESPPAQVDVPKAEALKSELSKPDAPKVETQKVEPGVTTGPEGKIYGTEFADARVVLKATGDDCWIQVREMDGSLLASRLLRKGDAFRIPNRPGLTLMVGNAGSLEVQVDGRKVAPLGAAGQVRRDIRLDPDKLP